MNQKQMRRYELIADLAVGADAEKCLAELCANDFSAGFEAWEFALARGIKCAVSGLRVFLAASESRAKTLFCDNLPLQKLLFNSPEAGESAVLDFLASILLSTKIETADECLSRLRGNTALDFNETMRAFLDIAFAQYCKKNDVRVPQFNRKQRDLLISHINKIKGPNKALLLQRLKEIQDA